jgi:hypothetical protein
MNAATIVFAAVAVISVVMLFVLLSQPAPAPRETTVVVNRSQPLIGPGGTEWPRYYGRGGTEWPRYVYGGGGHYGGGHYGGHYGGHGGGRGGSGGY